MNNNKYFLKTKQAGFVLSAVLLAALTQGTGSANAQDVGITIRPPVVVVSDDYVYYPNYGVYYNSHRHQYTYLKGDVWVNQPAPEGVSAEVLLASPSVDMEFHDSPEKHHAEMIKKYPRNWKPSGDHQDRKDDQKDAGHDRDKK